MLTIKLYISECILTTSLAVFILEPPPVCIIPSCESLPILCLPFGMEVEWLDPSNIVISSSTDRIRSKKTNIVLTYYL